MTTKAASQSNDANTAGFDAEDDPNAAHLLAVMSAPRNRWVDVIKPGVGGAYAGKLIDHRDMILGAARSLAMTLSIAAEEAEGAPSPRTVATAAWHIHELIELSAAFDVAAGKTLAADRGKLMS